MKIKVYEAIKKSGENGIRLRDIGYVVKEWHCGLLPYIAELMEEGKITSKTVGRGWQAYIKYYVKEV